MPEIRRFFLRLLTFFRADKADSDLTREINAHLQLLEDQFIAKGMTPEDARYAAKRAFGGVDQAKEQQRDTRSFRWLAGWSMDLKLGARMLVKTPGITIIAVIALAVGIGAGASYLEFVNGFFRGKLSFPGGDRLVGLLNWNLAKGDVEDRSLYEFAAWKTQLTTVEELGAARQFEEILTAEDGSSPAPRAVRRSARPHSVWSRSRRCTAGRSLTTDEKPGAEAVIVIGEELWRAHFHSDRAVDWTHGAIGRHAAHCRRRHAARFRIPGIQLILDAAASQFRDGQAGEGPRIRIFGRLAPGAGLGQAQAELETITARMDERRADAMTGVRASIHPFVESFWVDFTRSRSPMNPVLLLLYSFNILFIALLGICAANVAQLVFARTATRENEITVRTALGASRGRIVAQLVAEALVLASIAGIAGLVGAVDRPAKAPRDVGGYVKSAYAFLVGRTARDRDDRLLRPSRDFRGASHRRCACAEGDWSADECASEGRGRRRRDDAFRKTVDGRNRRAGRDDRGIPAGPCIVWLGGVFAEPAGRSRLRFPETSTSSATSGSKRARQRSARRRFGANCNAGSTRIRM